MSSSFSGHFVKTVCSYADVYVTAGNTLANAAVEKALTSEQWRQSDLHQRHSLYCNRALSAIHYASLAAADIEDDKERADTLAFLEEQKGNVFLEQVQNAPPLYNQMQHSPKSDDPQYRQKCLAGLNGFQKAQLTLDEEWEFQLSIAKLLRKLGTDSRQVLHHLAKACHLAKEFAGGSVESIYQLHATRLKLLQEDQLDLAALQQHCFLPETRLQLERITAAAGSVLPEHASSSSDTFAAAASTAAAASKLGNSATQSHQQQAELLYQDATSAMEYCLEQSKQNRGGQYETFHKARYRRAQALYQRGQQQQALAELQPLFKGKSKNGFAVNMYVIPEGVNKGKKVSLLQSVCVVSGLCCWLALVCSVVEQVACCKVFFVRDFVNVAALNSVMLQHAVDCVLMTCHASTSTAVRINV